MVCPKCGHENRSDRLDCLRCGVIFAKVRQGLAPSESVTGGTLLLKSRDPFGAAVCLWWFGENFLDIAPYINDARAGEMPLVGGNFGHSSPYGFHDWEYLLTESGLLRYDHALAKAAHLLGSLVMIGASAGSVACFIGRFGSGFEEWLFC